MSLHKRLICQLVQILLSNGLNTRLTAKFFVVFQLNVIVVKATKQTLYDSNLKAIVHHTPGSHAFPDIVIEFSQNVKYGIEVKSSTASKSKGWKINGNSVMGSTRDDSVIDTYIVFGKTSKNILEFRARRYEECVANVVVTHMLRIPVAMHNVADEDIYRPHAWSAFGTKDLESADYRACAAYGPLYK